MVYLCPHERICTKFCTVVELVRVADVISVTVFFHDRIIKGVSSVEGKKISTSRRLSQSLKRQAAFQHNEVFFLRLRFGFG